MKRKVITKRLEVKNKSFAEAIKSSVAQRSEIHARIVDSAQKSGVLSKLNPAK